jgi:hypothetical protein
VSIFNVPYEGIVAYHWLLLLSAGAGLILLFRKGEHSLDIGKQNDAVQHDAIQDNSEQPHNMDRTLVVLLPASIIYMCAVYLPFFAQPRYAYPVMPLVILIAACGLYSVRRRTSA